MKAYEFPTTITAAGGIELPTMLTELLPPNQEVRVIVLVPEPPPYDTDLAPEEEDEDWARLGQEEFLAHYDEADAVYDHTR